MKYLLQEAIPLVFTLNESESVSGIKKLRGLFHLAETKNANGRIYSKKLLEREVKRIMPAVIDRRILGEISHPQTCEINLVQSSHVITDLKMDGNRIFGELETIKTPAGRVLEGLIESNIKLGISSRGLGSLREEDGIKYVQDDFGLITWDVVPNPSTPDAWLNESYGKYVHHDLKLVEFGNENEIFENRNKITIETAIKNRTLELWRF